MRDDDNDGWQLIGETRIFCSCFAMEFPLLRIKNSEAAAAVNFFSAENFFPANGRMFVLRKINSAEGRRTRSYGSGATL